LRERHWRIFSQAGTFETVRGKGVVGLNLSTGKSWKYDTKNQRIFGRKVAVLYSYFFPILFRLKGPYQIKPEENIDQVIKS
jgi:hypothetical protein